MLCEIARSRRAEMNGTCAVMLLSLATGPVCARRSAGTGRARSERSIGRRRRSCSCRCGAPAAQVPPSRSSVIIAMGEQKNKNVEASGGKTSLEASGRRSK